VSARLEKRLDYLRQANAATAAEREVAAKAGAQQSTVISIPTGRASNGSPVDRGRREPGDGRSWSSRSAPSDGARAATRATTLVKQGDKVLAIMKSRAHHIDVNSDFTTRAELEGR
jgi:hypothetical protein